MTAKSIFFDLDGTLINSQQRLYGLFIEMTGFDLSYDRYWEIKRARINQKDFLKKHLDYSDESIASFKKEWLRKIEEPERLNTDFVVDGAESLLEKLKNNFNLYIVTNRQSQALTDLQLVDLGIAKYFKGIWATEQKTTKTDIIRRYMHPSPKDFFVGDTGEDIKDAHELGICSIAVSWGILSKDVLLEYKPDFIAERIEDIGQYCTL